MKRNKAFDSLIMVTMLRGFIEVGLKKNIAETGNYASDKKFLSPNLPLLNLSLKLLFTASLGLYP